jgi:hypothetical protein
VVGLDLAGDVVEPPLLEQHGVVLEWFPASFLVDEHQPVPVQGLDDQRASRPEDPKELAEGLTVALLPAVADGREQTENGVEALVLERQLAEVGLHPARPFHLAGEAPRLGELNL